MLEAITPYATIISAGSAFISAVAVLISTWFIIWTTYFRKTRRDRIDELKVEMQVLFTRNLPNEVIQDYTQDKFFKLLEDKFQSPEYEKVHQCAFDELTHERKNKIVRIREKREQAMARGVPIPV